MRLPTLLTIIALGLAGCGSDEPTGTQISSPTSSAAVDTSTPTPTQTPTASPSAEEKRGTVVVSADSEYGQILFDADGQAIYLFEKETTAEPACYDDCAGEWPPVLTDGEPVPGGAATADLLGTTERTDGSIQVTYAEHPLYYYAHEGKNEVRCHNVREFGGLWLVVTPSGEPAA